MFIGTCPYLEIFAAKPQNSRESSEIGHMVVIELINNINGRSGAFSVYHLVYS